MDAVGRAWETCDRRDRPRQGLHHHHSAGREARRHHRERRRHERRHPRGLRDPLRHACAQALGELHLRRSARRADVDRRITSGRSKARTARSSVDTGFDQAAANERGRKIINPIDEGLRAIGIAPDKVDHVICTHMHWDHAGNYDLFPNARYHMQDCEMAYATGRCMCHQMLRIPFSESDVLGDGEQGVRRSRRIPRRRRRARARHHASITSAATRRGCMCVRVKTQARPCGARLGLLPPLFAYRRGPGVSDHLQRRRHARGLPDAEEARVVAPSRRARSRSRCAELYPAAKTGLEDWVVRLDVEPKVLRPAPRSLRRP